MCDICGLPSYVNCNCIPTSAQPFCDQCEENTNCTSITDSQCVVYHFASPGYTPPPTKLINLGMPNGSTAEAIFEKIDQFIGNAFNIPLTVINTPSINLTANGVANHTLKADINVSAQPGNQVVIYPDGLFAPAFNPDYKVKVDANGPPRYLLDSVVGGTDGCVSISVVEQGGLLLLLPSLAIDCLIQKIRDEYLDEFCDLIGQCKCFIGVSNLVDSFGPACASGFTYDPVTNTCVQVNEQPPTFPGQTITCQPVDNGAWGSLGTFIYGQGAANLTYQQNGTGNGATLQDDINNGQVLTSATPQVWLNTPPSLFGAMNRSAVWSQQDDQATGPFGFTLGFVVPNTQTYYIGCGADNDFQISINGVLLVDTTLNPSAYTTYYNNPYAGQGIQMKFKGWHVYPVTIPANQINFLQVTGTNQASSDGGFGIEIYNNTPAQIQAAQFSAAYLADPPNFPLNQNYYDNLDLIFSTRCARQPGTVFSTGVATCPAGWFLDISGGAPLSAPCQGLSTTTTGWVCKQVITQPFTGYTATVIWDRIIDAIQYDVEQSDDGGATWTTTAGSPVNNPTTGTTVTLMVPGLPTNTFEFRVRPKYGTCDGPWVVTT